MTTDDNLGTQFVHKLVITEEHTTGLKVHKIECDEIVSNNITMSSTSTTGVLSNTDWNTFNNAATAVSAATSTVGSDNLVKHNTAGAISTTSTTIVKYNHTHILTPNSVSELVNSATAMSAASGSLTYDILTLAGNTGTVNNAGIEGLITILVRNNGGEIVAKTLKFTSTWCHDNGTTITNIYLDPNENVTKNPPTASLTLSNSLTWSGDTLQLTLTRNYSGALQFATYMKILFPQNYIGAAFGEEYQYAARLSATV